MKPLHKVIIVIVAAIVLVAALASAFDQIANSPILTKDLNSQNGTGDDPPKVIPDVNLTNPLQYRNLPDLNDTVIPPKLNYSVPNGSDENITMDGTNISGTVFNDSNGDGIRDQGEQQSGVGVQLYDQNGTLVGTTQTDRYGNYNFTGLDPGKYNISTFPGSNGNVTGGENRSISVDSGDQSGIDLNTTTKPAQNPTVATVTDIASPVSQFLIKKGVRFPVTGTVTTSSRMPVSGIAVDVFMAPSKTSVARYFIGQGLVRGGSFTVDCLIPNELPLGNYQLIARSLGSATYQPSESDPAVKVMDDTRLTIDLPGRVVMGVNYQCNITLQENASAKPVQAGTVYIKELGQHLQTDFQGKAQLNVHWSSPGIYRLTATYNGNETLFGSAANRTATVLDVSVEVAPFFMVRGYDNNLSILVHASELPVTSQAVVVYFEDYGVGAYTTDQEGRANVSVPVPYYHALGESKMWFDLPGIKGCLVNLTVKAMTTMKVELDGDQVNATLLDDHDQVMLSMPILLQRMDRTTVDVGTSKVGSEFSLGGEEGSDYLVNFTGSSIYQPSSAVVHYSPPGFGSLNDWMLVALLATVAAGAVVAFLLLRRKKHEPADLGYLPSDPAIRPVLSVSPYIISFPQIMEGLPLVWGEGEPLLFNIRGAPGDLHMEIDGNDFKLDPATGQNGYTVTLPRGDHLFSVTGPLGTTAVLVRAVNYREETVRLYRTAFDSWKTQGDGIADSMAPRELQRAMEKRLDRSRHGQLDVVVSLFEIAQFSQRPIGRPEYERMYRASDQVS